MNRKVLLVSLFSVALLAACTSRGATPTSDGSSEEGSSANSSSQPASTAQKVFTFKGFSFNAGTNFDTESKVEQLLNYLNSNESGFFTSLEVNKIASQASGNPQPTLCIGTSSSGGYITFNCKYDVVALDFKIQGFYKFYNETYNVDVASQVTVEGTTFNLPNAAATSATIPEEHNEHLELVSSRKSFTFSNSEAYQRVFLNELTVTYIA